MPGSAGGKAAEFRKLASFFALSTPSNRGEPSLVLQVTDEKLGRQSLKVSTSLEERIDPDTYHWRGKHDPPIFVSDLPFPAHL